MSTNNLPTNNGFLANPATLNEAMNYAKWLSNSSFVPTCFQSNSKNGDQSMNVFFACQFGAQLGLPPLQALQNIAVINGRPSIYGDLMIALCRKSPLCEYIVETFDEETKTWTCRAKRRGEPVEHVQSFGLQDAILAHYVTLDNNGNIKRQKWSNGGWVDDKFSPWVTNYKRMLQMRARSFCLRDTFPDLLSGVTSAEEAIDLPQTNGALNIEPFDISAEQVTQVTQVQEVNTATAVQEQSAPVRKRRKTMQEKIKELIKSNDNNDADHVTSTATANANEIEVNTADTTTDDAQEAPFTLEQIKENMLSATNIDDLNLACDVLKDIKLTDEQRATLTELYKNRASALK